tara:strand:+ start:1554 stop:3809 length:2256 start_codon:yes stop_codon:yes gene_type:complete
MSSFNRKLAGLINDQGKLKQSTVDGIDSSEASSVINSEVAAGVSYFDTLDSLPTTGLSSGLKALVNISSTEGRLYVYNGDGWYNADTNLNTSAPVWLTEPNSSYNIADSVTPLSITAIATDADSGDVVVSSSYVSDSAQYMVDITIDSSVWTFTPKTKSEIAAQVAAGNLTDSNGDFIYTFQFTDGVNVLSKATTISYNPANTGTPFFYSQVRGLSVPATIAASTQFRIRSIAQDDSDSYYLLGQNNTSPYSGILMKFDDDGDYQWIQGYANGGGTKKTTWQANTVVVDPADNKPIVTGYEYGYGKNLQQSYMPISSSRQMTTFPAGYQKKFKSDGSSEDYTKIFRYSSFPSIGGQWNYSYGNNSDTIVRNSVVYNSAIWHLAKHDQENDQTGGFNYYRDVPAIYKTSLSGGLASVYMMRPGSSNSSSSSIFQNKGRVDPIAFNVLGGNLYVTAETSDGDKEGIIFKLSSSGTPTYSWYKGHAYGKYLSGSGNNASYESPSSWSYSRFSPVCLDPNDNNLIVTGWMRPGTGTNGNQFSGDAQILLKLDDTDGSIIWGKYLDADNGASSRPYGTMGSVALHNNDYLVNVTASGSPQRCYVKLINISDGTVNKLYELSLTGQSTTGADWTYDLGNYLYRCMTTNSEGAAVLAFNVYGGSDYRVSLLKFPLDFGNWTGVHGSQSEGNIELTDITDTYTDQDMTFAYVPSGYPLTFGSMYGNMSSYFSSVNYNSGDGYTNQNFTPTTSSNWKVII